MKKNLILLLIVALFATTFTACQNKKNEKPENMNQEIYNYGVKATEIINKYLEADLTGKEAEEKIDTLLRSAESIESDEPEDNRIKASLSLLHAEFRSISYNEIDDSVSDGDLEELRETRDDLLKALNSK